jgi:hypothetical protein
MYTAGSCATGLSAFYPGSRLVYALFLGPATPLGGTLTLTTCGHTTNNTAVYVGTGCPTWDRPFGCLAGNDNAEDAGAACDGNPLASTLVLRGVPARSLYVQVGGVSGAPVVSGLRWAYSPPPSRSATASRAVSGGGGGGSRSGTRPPSPSRSRTRKPK